MQLLKNVLSDWSFLFVSFVTILFLTPFIVGTLGHEKYGLWALILSIVSFYNLADFGTTSAMRRYYSQAIGRNDTGERVRIFSNVLAVFSVVAIIILGIAAILSLVAPYWFKLNPTLVHEFRIALLILGLSTAILFFLKPYGGVLAAYERYDIVNIVEVIGAILQAAGIFLVLKTGYGLIAMACVLLAVTTTKGLIEAYIAMRRYDNVRFERSIVSFANSRHLLNYSAISFVVIICDYLRVQLDTILVGAFISVATVIYYAIASQFVLYYVLIARTISKTFVPRLSRLEGGGNWSELRATVLNGTRLSATLVLFIAISIIVFAQKFLSLWLGPGFNISYYILLLLIPANAITLIQSILVSLLYATSNHGFYAKLYVIETLVKLAISLALIPLFGIYGLAAGTLISVLLVKSYLQPAKACGIAGITLRQLIQDGLSRPLQFAALYSLFSLPVPLLLRGTAAPFATFVVLVLVYAAIGGSLTYFIVLNREERVKFWQLLHRIANVGTIS